MLTISEHFLVRDPNYTNESAKLPPFIHDSHILIRKCISYAVLKSLKPHLAYFNNYASLRTFHQYGARDTSFTLCLMYGNGTVHLFGIVGLCSAEGLDCLM